MPWQAPGATRQGSLMFRKVLVANRGEIAIRAFRAAFELGISTVAVFPYEDRNSLHRAKADEAYQIGEPGHPVRAYLSVDEVIKAARKAGADAIYPGYGFLSENPDLAAACAEAGITFVGPPASVLHLTGNKSRAVAAAREAGVPVLKSSEPSTDVDALLGGRRGHRFPAVRQGRRRWRRTGHAPGGRARRAAGGDRRGDARGAVRVRRRDGLPRAGRGEPAPYRSADPRRRRRQCRAPVRAGLLGAAAPPEGRRDRARTEPRPGPARADLRRRRRLRPPHRVRQRGHRGVPRRRARQPRLHRDEPAYPGGAHGHRAGHRPGPGDRATAHRRGHDSARTAPDPGRHRPERHRPAVPYHHRGPRQRLPARHRHHLRLPLTGRARRPARRRHGAHRRRGVGALRLDAGQAHLPRARLRQRRPPRAPGDRRVPYPRSGHQPALPRRGARPPRIPGGPHHDELHRRASGADAGPPVGRPRQPHAHLPRRDDRQPAARAPPGRHRPQSTSCLPPHSPRRRPTAPGSASRRWDRRPSPPNCAASRPSPSRTRRSATRTSPCSPPGCAPAICSPWPRMSRARAAAAEPGVLGRRDLRRGAALPRRGPLGASRGASGRRCPMSARRCCCAGATPLATRPIRPR